MKKASIKDHMQVDQSSESNREFAESYKEKKTPPVIQPTTLNKVVIEDGRFNIECMGMFHKPFEKLWEP